MNSRIEKCNILFNINRQERNCIEITICPQSIDNLIKITKSFIINDLNIFINDEQQGSTYDWFQ